MTTYLLSWPARHLRTVWWSVFALCTLPGLSLLVAGLTGALGVNALETLTRDTGNTALVLLLVALSLTPARALLTWTARRLGARYGRRLPDWNWLIRLRRLIGVSCFTYAFLHLLVWLHFDVAWTPAWMREEIAEKSYLLVGVAALLVLLPLAVTSCNAMCRLLGVWWRRLHRLTYLAGALAVGHYWLLAKVGDDGPLPYVLLLGALLGYRLLASMGWLDLTGGDEGVEIPPRDAAPAPAHAPATPSAGQVPALHGRLSRISADGA